MLGLALDAERGRGRCHPRAFGARPMSHDCARGHRPPPLHPLSGEQRLRLGGRLLQGPPHENTSQVLAVGPGRVDVRARVRPLGRQGGRVGDRGAAGQGGLHGGGPQRRRAHVDQGHRRALDGHADHREVDRPLVELLERPRGRGGGLGHLDLRQQLAGLKGGLEDPLEELRGRDRAGAGLAADHEGRVEREQGGRQVGGRVGVRDRPADRAPVPDLRVAHGLGRVREQRDVRRAAAARWPRRGAW